MSQYARQIATAKRLIEKHGENVIWTKRVVTEGDKPWKEVAGQAEEFPVSMLFLRPGSSLATAIFQLMKGTDVVTGGVRALMAAQVSFEPEMTDYVVRDGVSMSISRFNPLAPAGIAILYEIEFVD